MTARWNPETQSYEDPLLAAQPDVQPTGAELVEQYRPRTFAEQIDENDQRRIAQWQQQESSWQASKGADIRPVVASDLGMAARDLGRVVVNWPLAAATDIFVDLPAMAGDAVGGLIDTAMGRDVDWMNRFNDADNPLTSWRRSALRPESQAAEVVSNILRFVPTFAKGFATGGVSVLSKLPAIGGAVNRGRRLLGGLSKLDDAPQLVTRVDDLRQAVGKSSYFADKASAGSKALDRMRKAPYLETGFKDVSNLVDAKNWWQGVEAGVDLLTSGPRSLGKPKKFLKSAAEVLGWDLFIAFNVAGEGTPELDENIFDILADWESSNPAVKAINAMADPLASRTTDTALALKAKQMVDAVITGTIGQALFDTVRIARYAQAYKKASPEQKRYILQLFEEKAEDFGADFAVSMENLEELRRVSGVDLDSVAVPGPIPGELGATVPQQGKRTKRGSRLNVKGAEAPSWEAPGIDQSTDLGSVDALPLAEERNQDLVMGLIQTLEAGRRGGGDPVLEAGPFRAAYKAMANRAVDLGLSTQLRLSGLRRLLPQRRTAAIDYIQTGLRPTRTELGLLDPADSFVLEETVGRGLQEGWARINPETLMPQVNWSMARQADLDASEARLAQLEDQGEELLRQQQQQKLEQLKRMAEEEAALRELEDLYPEEVPTRGASRASREAFEEQGEQRLARAQQQARLQQPLQPSAAMQERAGQALAREGEQFRAAENEAAQRQFENDPAIQEWMAEEQAKFDAEQAARTPAPAPEQVAAQAPEPVEGRVPGVSRPGERGAAAVQAFEQSGEERLARIQQEADRAAAKDRLGEGRVRPGDEMRRRSGLVLDRWREYQKATKEAEMNEEFLGLMVNDPEMQAWADELDAEFAASQAARELEEQIQTEQAFMAESMAPRLPAVELTPEERGLRLLEADGAPVGVPQATMQKEGRVYRFYGPDGEPLDKAPVTNKKSAESLLNRINRRLEREWKKEQKQQRLDGEWQDIRVSDAPPTLREDVTVEVPLTKAQETVTVNLLGPEAVQDGKLRTSTAKAQEVAETISRRIDPDVDLDDLDDADDFVGDLVEVRLTKAQRDELIGNLETSEELADAGIDIVQATKGGRLQLTPKQADVLFGRMEFDYAGDGAIETMSPSLARSMSRLTEKLADAIAMKQAELYEAEQLDGLVDDAFDLFDNGEICDLF